MLSPRTLALRKKNRDLLEALDLKVCSRKSSVNESPFRYDIHNPLTRHFSDISCQAFLRLKSSPEGVTQSLDNFSGLQSTLGSGDLLHANVYDATSKAANRSQEKKPWNLTRNVNASRTDERIKSISLHQQRAAEVQMHAPTHSHAISKCYCTQENKTKVKVDSKYIVQLFGRRQRIPTRVKEQRYRAASVPRNTRAVRWADTCDNVEKRSPKCPDDLSTVPSQELSEVSVWSNATHEDPPLMQCAPHQNESESKLLDKVKAFRKSHWSDCHSTSRVGVSPSDHECVKHYVLNKRLFLEPLHTDEGGHATCPVCPLSSISSCRAESHIENTNHPPKAKFPDQESHIIVTLPKAILEPENLRIGRSFSTHQKYTKGDSKLKTCYSIGHHVQSAKEKAFVCPSDSLALRYQKREF